MVRRRENEFLISESLKQNVLFKLNEAKLPRSYLHRSNPNDVARVEQFTFICTPTKEEAGPTNNWSEPSATYLKLQGLLKGAMRGRTMFVIPYIMGPPDSPLTKVGFEITDSNYVVLSMRVMTRMGEIAVKRLGNDPKGEWNRGVHSLLDVNPERRLICHFPQDNTIISVGSGYGGNVLLRKNVWHCESVLISPATRLARRTHADSRGRVADREKTLRRGGVPERVRQNQFRDVDSAETFCRVESHDRWR